VAGTAVLVDSRWSSVKLMVQVAMGMITLILVAAIRARGEFDSRMPLTWLLLAGFVAVLAGAAYLSYAMGNRARTSGGRLAADPRGTRETLPR